MTDNLNQPLPLGEYPYSPNYDFVFLSSHPYKTPQTDLALLGEEPIVFADYSPYTTYKTDQEIDQFLQNMFQGMKFSLVEPQEARKVVPYAFIRFSNERTTIRQCLESIKGFCDRGILCYHELFPWEQPDGSVEIAAEFCRQNPGFRLVKYPFPVIPASCQWFLSRVGKDNRFNRFWLLDCFYNYALIHLKKLAEENGEFEQAALIKIDCDHIYNPNYLRLVQRIFERAPYLDLVNLGKYDVGKNPYSFLPHYLQEFYKETGGRPTYTDALFVRYVCHFDHMFALIKNYTFAYAKFFLPQDKTTKKPLAYGQNPAVDKLFDYYEVLELALSRVPTSIADHSLTSYHFNPDKFYHQILFSYGTPQQVSEEKIRQFYITNPQKINFLKEHPNVPRVNALLRDRLNIYKGFPIESSLIGQYYLRQFELDPEFWSEQTLLKIINEQDYYYISEWLRGDLPPKFEVTQEAIDKLCDNPRFNLDMFIAELNALKSRIDPATQDYQDFLREKDVWNILLNEATGQINIHYLDYEDENRDNSDASQA